MKHKHAEMIKAWADGAKIQSRWDMTDGKGWSDWRDEDESPEWFIDWEYRIKPEEKKPFVRWKWVYKSHGYWVESEMFMSELDIEIRQKIFPVEKYFKLEYTRTEFEE